MITIRTLAPCDHDECGLTECRLAKEQSKKPQSTTKWAVKIISGNGLRFASLLQESLNDGWEVVVTSPQPQYEVRAYLKKQIP